MGILMAIVLLTNMNLKRIATEADLKEDKRIYKEVAPCYYLVDMGKSG